MLDLDMSLTAKILIWLITGGGAGVVAFWIWDKIEKASEKARGFGGCIKRWVILGIGAIISVLAFLCLAWFGLVALPSSPQAWVNTIIAVVGLAYVSSQQAHGGFVLAKRKKDGRG